MDLLRFVARLLELERHRKLSRPRLIALQLKKFRRLVRYAIEQSPYYSKIAQARGIVASECYPDQFPVLTREDVLTHFDEIVTDSRLSLEGVTQFVQTSQNTSDRFLGRFRVIHTTGTTGSAGFFVYDKNEWLRGLLQMPRVRRFRVGSRLACVIGGGAHATSRTMAITANCGPMGVFVRSRTFDFDEHNRMALDQLNEFQPHVVVAYATKLLMLAERQREGRLAITPEALISSGEGLTRDASEFVEEVFGTQINNTYVSSECMYLGVAKPHLGGLVLFEDDTIFELRDDCTLVSNLFNFTMPLIRYRLDDVLTEVSGSHPSYPGFRRVTNSIIRTAHDLRCYNADGQQAVIPANKLQRLDIPGVLAFRVRAGRHELHLAAHLRPTLGCDARRVILAELKRRATELLRDHGVAGVNVVVNDTPGLLDSNTGAKLCVVDNEAARQSQAAATSYCAPHAAVE